jgi:lysyl-tRNA synthetase class 2
VETPALSRCTSTDPAIASLHTEVAAEPGGRYYLQPSPEPALKRLVAAHGVAVYQLGKAFRDGERGTLHNPEFTLLEWYRPGWDHFALVGEVEALVEHLLGPGASRRVTYREAFLAALRTDPFEASVAELRRQALDLGLDPTGAARLDRDGFLEFLFAVGVQPALADTRLVTVLDYPGSQAALARVRPGPPAVAERFEAFVRGIEVANGYHELTDAGEQRARSERDLARRRALALPEPPLDARLLQALATGLPPCAGVAVGVDRLVMAVAGTARIDQVLAFPLERA